MLTPLRSGLVSLMLLAALPLAVGCGPEVSAEEEQALLGEQAALGSAAAPQAAAGTDKVAVCHIPPGNPANAHTIVVGAPAVAAHLSHGDRLEACDAGDGGDDGEGGGDGGGDDSCRAAAQSCSEQSPCCAGLGCGEEGLCVPVIN
jgi:hypothetical protein